MRIGPPRPRRRIHFRFRLCKLHPAVDGSRWERNDEGPGTSQPALGNGVVPECPAVLGPEEQGHPRSGSVGILVAILGIRSLPGVDCSGDI